MKKLDKNLLREIQEIDEAVHDNEAIMENEEDYDRVIDERIKGYSKSGRPIRIPAKYIHLQVKTSKNIEEYNKNYATVIGKIMNYMEDKYKNDNKEISCVQTYNAKQGIKRFQDKGKEAITKEMDQLHKRRVFEPINPGDLTRDERNKAMESLIFLTEKKNGIIKARACANSSSQRDYIGKEKASSPTVLSESIMMTAIIDANEDRDK